MNLVAEDPLEKGFLFFLTIGSLQKMKNNE